MNHSAHRHLSTVPVQSSGPARTWRRVLVTLPSDGCAALAEDLGLTGRRFVSLLVDSGEITERRYSSDPDVAVRHARSMLDEHTRRLRAVV